MDGDPRMPPPPPPPSAAPTPVSATAAPKKKAQRLLGLAPPPASIASPATSRASTGPQGSGAITEEVAATAAPPRKRPPRDPTVIAAARKARAGKKGAAATQPTPAPPPPPAASVSTPPAAGMAPTPPPAAAWPDAQDVLGEMPLSVDDESFLNMTCGTPFGIDDFNPSLDVNNASLEEGLDMEEEGFVDHSQVYKKKGSRGANFTMEEDETLVKAWEAITLDAISGVEQERATCWERIHDHFQTNNKSGIYRSQVSLTHCWQTIQADCSKWAACLEQVERLNPSGTNPQDKVNIAHQFYKGKPKKKGGKAGKAFGLQHCWALLQYDEKWRTRNNEVPSKRQKSSNSCSPDVEDSMQVDSDDEDSDDAEGRRSPTPSSAAPSRKTLAGRKAEKERLKKGGEISYKDSLDNMVSTRKELAAERKELKTTRWQEIKEMEERRALAKERRATAEERRVAAEEMNKRIEQEQRLMFMDPKDLDEKGRAYYDLMRDQVLAARTMGGFMGGFDGFGGIGGIGGFGGNGSSSDMGGNGAFGGNGSSSEIDGNGSG